jgi:serine protease Do
MYENWQTPESVTPPTPPYEAPPRQLPPPPPDGLYRARPARTWLVAGVVGAIVSALVSFGVVKLVDDGGTKTVVQTQGPARTVAPTPSQLKGGSLDIQGLLAKATPSVVSIYTSTPTGALNANGDPLNPPDTLQPGIVDPGQVQQAAGSGFIVSADGLAITNAHVAAGADNIRVRFADGKSYDAKVVGFSRTDDLALIQLKNAKGLQPADLGDSQALRVGDDVVAIGNALALGTTPTVTKGIVSATNRTLVENAREQDPNASATARIFIDGVIQTDAAINPGNSGGPLLNALGEVVGVNTAIVGDSQNIGFSIPVDTVKSLLPDLKNGNGGDIGRKAGFLGVVSLGVDLVSADVKSQFNVTADNGAFVQSVSGDSPAASAGLKQGDVIIKVDGTDVQSSDDLGQAIRAKKPGDSIVLDVVRQGNRQQFTAKLVARA